MRDVRFAAAIVGCLIALGVTSTAGLQIAF